MTLKIELPNNRKFKKFRIYTKVVVVTNITVSELHLKYLLKRVYARDIRVVTLFDGGVIGDMTGFAASIYQRGIDFIQIPTTLLSQVQVSEGKQVLIIKMAVTFDCDFFE